MYGIFELMTNPASVTEKCIWLFFNFSMYNIRPLLSLVFPHFVAAFLNLLFKG